MRLASGFLLVLCSLGILRAQPVCTFVGDAASLGGDCYQITDNNEWELGAVWFNEQLDLNQPFIINVDINLGNQDADGADGVVFVMQSVGPLAIGDAGGGLGFEGFNPSFGVEIDTWQNTDIGDLSLDHVAFHRDGINWHNAPYFNLAGPVPARADGANIEDGQEGAATEEHSIAHKEKTNINVRAAFIHVIGDFLQSLGVLVAALIIYYKVS